MSKGLIRKYSDDISDELSDQLFLLKMTFSVTLSAPKSIKDLAEFILITHSESSSSFSDNNLCLFALSDISCDSCQRWKKFFEVEVDQDILACKTESQVRLSSLAILSIDSRRVEDVDTDKIIDSFDDNKARKKSF